MVQLVIAASPLVSINLTIDLASWWRCVPLEDPQSWISRLSMVKVWIVFAGVDRPRRRLLGIGSGFCGEGFAGIASGGSVKSVWKDMEWSITMKRSRARGQDLILPETAKIPCKIHKILTLAFQDFISYHITDICLGFLG